MYTEVDILETFIKKDYGTKIRFAAMMGMTTQNLNHHIRIAKENGDVFREDFKAKLWLKGIHILDNNQPQNSVAEESQSHYNSHVAALNRIIKMQEDTIKRLERELSDCRQLTVNIREKAKSA